jgi:hypothetical protein
LAFVKPEKFREGIKILAYGESGSGKTPFVLSFPELALIDADSSSNFYKNENPNIVVMTNSASVKEITEELEELENEDNFEQIQSLGVDSISRLYENLQHAALKVVEKRARANGRAIESEGLSVKEWGVIKLHYDRFNSKLHYYSKLGKNVIVVAEGKDEKEALKQADGTVTYVVKGQTYNSQKGAEFDFDIVLEFIRDGKGGSIARVIKDRTNTFNPDDKIEMANYSHWKETIEKAQIGKQRVKEEIKSLDHDINKDVENFNTADSIENKINKLVEEMKIIYKEKLSKGIDKIELNKITGKGNYKTVEEVEEILKRLKKLKK